MASRGMARCGRLGEARIGTVGNGAVWQVWHAPEGLGEAWLGMAGAVRHE